MREKGCTITIALILMISLVIFLNIISDKSNATPTVEKFALIAVSSVNQTHETEYDKSIAFYEYLIDEGYTQENIYYYGPDSITYTDDESTVSNIEEGFESIINASTIDDDVVIYISDHIQHISVVQFYFNDGVIDGTQMGSWLDSISCSDLTFIMNGNRSGLVQDFREPGRTIMSSMSSIDEFSPDYFNITRSLENNLADANWDGVVSFTEAFYYERYLLFINQYPQHPQIWID